MLLLENNLAQQIVNRTMKIIGNNINVMSHRGVIIGSGDPLRIGQIHDAALLALQHSTTIEVTKESSLTLKGVLPGINLVLQVNEQIIGVVGITGDPDECRKYADLVKMTAEMIVEHAGLTEQLQWDRRHREEFITSWINTQTNDAKLLGWAKKLDIDISAPRIAVLIRFRETHQPISLQGVRKIVELLEYPIRDNLVAVVSLNEIVVLKPATFIHGQWDCNDENRRIDLLFSRLKEYDMTDIDIALGHYFDGEGSVARSYESAQLTLEWGLTHQPQKHKHLYEDLRLPVLLSPLHQSWQGQQLHQPYQLLIQEDKNGQLVKTLVALFQYRSLTECANSLYIHRNTLRYRINRIRNITKIDPETIGGLLELHLGYLLER